MKRPRYSVSQIMTILKQAESGTPVSQLCREHGMSSASFYKWQAKYGGMNTSMMSRLKELEAKNSSSQEDVRRCPASKRCYQRGHVKKVVRPARRKDMAKRAVSEGLLSIRAACAAFTISQTCYRYEPKLSHENGLIVH